MNLLLLYCIQLCSQVILAFYLGLKSPFFQQLLFKLEKRIHLQFRTIIETNLILLFRHFQNLLIKKINSSIGFILLHLHFICQDRHLVLFQKSINLDSFTLKKSNLEHSQNHNLLPEFIKNLIVIENHHYEDFRFHCLYCYSCCLLASELHIVLPLSHQWFFLKI